MPDKKPSPKSPQKVRVARPDELSSEAFEFIAAIDEFKRTRMVSIVTLEDVVGLLGELGYALPAARGDELTCLEKAVDAYKKANERLFPNWSEVFGVILELGYRRKVA